MESLALRFSPVVVVASLAAACSGAAMDPSSSDDGNARIATVQSALVQPTGTVSPSSVRALASDWQSFQQVVGAFDAVLAVGASNAQACLMGATPSDTDAAESTEADGSAVAVNGAYDLSCVTGGKVVGKLAFQLEPRSSQDLVGDAGPAQQVAVQFDDACAGDACVTGSAFVSIGAPVPGGCTELVTLAVTATVTIAGASRTFSFGAQGGAGLATLSGVTVYFDDEGRSLSVQSSGDGSSAGPVLVSGDGQSFECTLTPTGGRCDGATSFVY